MKEKLFQWFKPCSCKVTPICLFNKISCAYDFNLKKNEIFQFFADFRSNLKYYTLEIRISRELELFKLQTNSN